ncbi:MFS transporter [Streptomyces sp. NBC_00669]|uniref:MFS transporter n=1 Tax=unclassified Streptomyces TaxID=2593676 RepID=UPI002E38192B|nr:MFS transporter [Streptomyces sp. NBC_00669]
MSVPDSPDSQAVRSRAAALAVLSAGTLMIILDGTIVNVALPSIQHDLGFSQANLAWVVNAYLIAFAGLLLLSGRLGDLLGRRRVLVTGLAAFTAASFLCGIADSAGLLIAARFVQGAAGAMVSAVALGMVLALYPDPHGRARAMGIYSFTQSAGGVLGLLAGGILTQAINWHWIFFVNLPIGLAAALLSLRLLPDDRPSRTGHDQADRTAGTGTGTARGGLRGTDAPGAVLVTAALMLGVYTIVKTTDRGWTSAPTAGFGAASLALLAAFLVRQARAAQPLMPLRIFRSRIVAGANAVQVLVVAGGFGFQFMTSLYLQHVLGYDPLEIGLSLAPTGVAIGVMSLVLSARLGARFGQRAVLLPSLVLFAGAFLLLARTPSGGPGSHASYVADILPPILLMGVAFGLVMPSLLTLGMAEAGPADSGLVSGVFNTAQQIGGALGLATLASIAGTRTEHRLAAGRTATTALADGYHLAFVVAAGLLTAAAVLAGVLLRTPAGQAPAGQSPTGTAGPDELGVSSSRGSRPAPGPAGRKARV